MLIIAEFALYPLRTVTLGPILEEALAAARTRDVQITGGPMSSLVEGSAAEVFAALQAAFSVVAARGDVVLVASISNACSPVPD